MLAISAIPTCWSISRNRRALPAEEARAVLTERRFKDAVDADWAKSRQWGVTGVPTFVAARYGVVGAQPYEVLEQLLDKAGARRRARRQSTAQLDPSCATRPARSGTASISYDGALGRQIIELHVWAVRQGLRGIAAAELFEGLLSSALVMAGVPLWRASAAMRTLHPQWGGYSYLWRRDLNAIEPSAVRARQRTSPGLADEPVCLSGRPSRRAGGTESVAASASASGGTRGAARFSGARRARRLPAAPTISPRSCAFGAEGDASRGTGIAYSFATDRPGRLQRG